MNNATNNKELTITRTFNAPRRLVWDVWTRPEHMTQWWAPNGFTNSGCEIDLRPGGKWQICMDHPQFPDHWVKGVFKEVEEPERLVFTTTAFIGSDGVPEMENLNSVTFTEHDGKTTLTLHVQVLHATPAMAPALAGMDQGWSQSLDKLDRYTQAQYTLHKQLKRSTAARTCTYLNFPGNTEEAFNFYKTIFRTEFHGGIQHFGDIPAGVDHPPLSDEHKKMVLHVELPILGGHMLMATDAPQSMGFTLTPGNNMHISLEPETREETKRLFDGLAEGGSITMPLADMFFGSYFGSCTDKYGVNWMFNCTTQQ